MQAQQFSTPRKNLQVAVVGGGVCGLVCAIALIKRGVSVQIYEAAAVFGAVGAGIGIGTNATRILDDLDLLGDVIKTSGLESLSMSTSWFQFRSGSEGHDLIFDYTTAPGEGSIGTHRAAFLDALVKHVDQGLVHFNKKCNDVVQPEDDSSQLVMKFTDGTEAFADVVLGADGIKSAVRGAVFGTDASSFLSFSNTVCYRALIPIEYARAAGVTRDYSVRPICYVGKDKHLIVYPLKDGSLINVVAFASDHEASIGEHNLPPDAPTIVPVDTEELLREYKDFGTEVTALLRAAKQSNKWIINVVYPPLQTYARGRIALLGDAAHAMLPHLGAGAGQGIEDAEVLSRLLSHPQTNLENVADVLKVYDEVRRPRAQQMWQGSVDSGRVADGRGPSGDSAEGLRKDLAGMWDSVWRHDLDADVQRGLRSLEERGIFLPSASL